MLMYMFTVAVFSIFVAIVPALGKQIVITVGSSSMTDATKVFSPSTVTANNGDVVFFNFTHGNHTVTQSTFAFPCVRIHDYDVTKNGFDSSFRDAGNAQAITNLPVTVTNASEPIWFFDWNTCGQGGVGAINIRSKSSETYEGFVQNAFRLNGTAASSTSGSSTATTTSPSSQTSSNSAMRLVSVALYASMGSFLVAALST